MKDPLAGLRALLHFDNAASLVVSRTFFPHDSLLVYRKGDLQFLVDHAANDHNGTRLCLISDIYRRFVPLMKLGPIISVFDLGANGGGFPLLLHLEGKTFSRVVCVELNPNTYRRLQYNISTNLTGNCRVVNAAVCGSDRDLHLQLGRGDISDTIYQSDSHPAGTTSFSVPGRTFDSLFEEHFAGATVDICKMDIEGAEFEVLESAKCQDLRRCRYLLVEIHSSTPQQLTEFRENLAALGFVACPTKRETIPGEFLFSNARLE